MEGRAGEHLLHDVDGEPIWLHVACNVIVNSGGRQQGWMLVINDLTSAKRAEAQAQDANLFQQLVLESIPDYLLVKDQDYRIVLANSNFINLYPEEKRDKVIGFTTLEDYEPEERDAFLSEDRKAFAEGFSETEETILFPDGEERTLLTKKQRFVNNSGVPFILALARDVTDMKRAQEDLFQANQDLELSIERANSLTAEAQRLNAAKSEFLANMSHEIRTPMNGIIGTNSLLLETGLNPVQQEYAETIEASSEALLVLINDILDLSKIESGKITLEDIPFDLSSLAHDMSVSLAVTALDKGLQFLVDVDPSLPLKVRGDPGRIQQVLLNLVSNAMKFTQEGSVRLVVEQLMDPFGIGSRIDPSIGICALRFSVEDTGIGIAPEFIERLFEKFTQMDASITRRFGGTGLGLAISQSLVAMMGGMLEVTSEVNKGSRFSFVLHLTVEQQAPPVESIIDRSLLDVVALSGNADESAILRRQLDYWQLRSSVCDSWPSVRQAFGAY